jgi:multiple sugar transport system permease protein
VTTGGISVGENGAPARMHRYALSARQATWALIRIGLIVGVAYVILYPLLAKLASSFMSEADLFDQTVRWVPKRVTLSNYVVVWQHMNYPRAFLNSFFLTLGVSVLQLISCTLVGYGFRYKFPLKNLWFALVILTLVVPPQMVMIPLYFNFRFFNLFGLLPDPGVNLVGSPWPFFLMAATGTGLKNGLFIYMTRQFFKGMPKELEEAAYVDGAGMARTFLTIMVPGALPVLVTVFIFSFVWQWNDYFLTSLLLRNYPVLATALSSLQASVQASGASYQRISLLNNTGSLMFMAPLLLLYAFLQRRFTESIERTGIVG